MLAMDDKTPQQRGGYARAASLSKDTKTDIARKAAQARWADAKEIQSREDLPFATHQGQVHVDGLDLDCYVLQDGRRVFHKRGMARAMGLKSAGGNAFLKTVQGKVLASYIGADLTNAIENPFYFRAINGDVAHGYDADILVEVC